MAEKDRIADYLTEIPNFLSVFIFSIFFYIASPILIEISKSTNIAITNLSFIFTFFSIGAFIGQMTSVFFNRRFRKLNIVLAGFIIQILLTIILSFSSNLILFYIMYVISGYTLGVIWIQANEYILESKIKNKERLITITVTFFPIGAFIAPFISSLIIEAGLSWRFVYYIIILLISINIILYIFILGRKKEILIIRNEEKLPPKDIFINKSKNLILIFVLLAVFFYSCSETVVATWVPSFFRLARNLTVQTASLTLNLFWLFIIIGRAITLILAGRIKSTKIMIAISILAIISLIGVILVNNKYLIFVLISIVGLGYSAMFPLLYFTGATLYEKGKGMLATFLFISLNIGKAIAPFITKYTSKISLELSVSFSFIFMLIVTIIVILITFLLKKDHSYSY